MKTSEMSKKLRKMSTWKTGSIINRQDAKFLGDVADRLDEQEERIAIMTEPEEATAEQLTFPPAHICKFCKWFVPYTNVCTNGWSEHRADCVAPDSTCVQWEDKTT